MGFGALSSAQQIMIRLVLLGGPKYQAEMIKSGVVTKDMVKQTSKLDAALNSATKRSWAMNQAMFTLRRTAFYGTIALAGMAAVVVKMGFSFLNTMNTARVAFESIGIPTRQVTKEVNSLYVLAARTPFEFPDIVTATRRLYPFIGNMKMTNMVVKDLVNTLSAMGLYSPQYLNRASLALGHMFAIGKVTGQTLYQLARDNILMLPALEEHYHKTGAEIRDMVSKGLIPAVDAAKALNEYTVKHGYGMAAFKQATKTLPGAWSTFKDILGMAAGRTLAGGTMGGGGIYGYLQKKLQAIDQALIPPNKGFNQLHITLTNIAEVINSKLTPGSNLIINTFLFLTGVVKGLVIGIGGLAWVIGKVLSGIDSVFRHFGIDAKAATVLGYALGFLLTAFLAFKGIMLVRGIIATVFSPIVTIGSKLPGIIREMKIFYAILRGATFMKDAQTGQFMKFNKWQNAVKNLRKAVIDFKTYITGTLIPTIVNYGKVMMTWFVNTARAAWVAITTRLIPALGELWASTWIWLTTNPFGWLLIAVTAFLILISTIVILYFKWKWFHDIVNDTAKWLWKNYGIVALIVALIPGLGPMVSVAIIIAKNWKTVWGVIMDVYNALKKIADKLLGPWHFLMKILGIGGGSSPTAADRAAAAAPFKQKPNPLFTKQTPSIFQSQNPAWWQQQPPVDRIITPQKRGTVQATHADVIQRAPQVQSAADVANFIKQGETHVTIQLDRKTIATAVARANQDKAALK